MLENKILREITYTTRENQSITVPCSGTVTLVAVSTKLSGGNVSPRFKPQTSKRLNIAFNGMIGKYTIDFSEQPELKEYFFPELIIGWDATLTLGERTTLEREFFNEFNIVYRFGETCSFHLTTKVGQFQYLVAVTNKVVANSKEEALNDFYKNYYILDSIKAAKASVVSGQIKAKAYAIITAQQTINDIKDSLRILSISFAELKEDEMQSKLYEQAELYPNRVISELSDDSSNNKTYKIMFAKAIEYNVIKDKGLEGYFYNDQFLGGSRVSVLTTLRDEANVDLKKSIDNNINLKESQNATTPITVLKVAVPTK